MRAKRVVVTGLGLISPSGNSVDAAWENISRGKSGISAIAADRFDTSDLPCTFAGQVAGFDPADWVEDPKDLKKMDLYISYAIAAGTQAVQDADMGNAPTAPTRKGVAIGSGIGGIGFIETACNVQSTKGSKRLSPFFIPGSITNMAAGHLSMMYNCQGPNLAIATACTSGTHMIGLAGRLIASDDADVMICGGSEAPITRLCMAGFGAARALSTCNADPQAASRPWDAARDGFVMGEGAGVLVLESLEHAQERDARIYAELLGFGMSGDAFHITLPEEHGTGAFLAMQSALGKAELQPEAINYINAHGTSTQAGDRIEVAAIKRLFGAHADKLLVSSTKSMTGHLLGAAGAIEAVFSTLTIRHQTVPPTVNLDQPGEGCDLNFVPHQAVAAPVDYVISNSFGFGGTNGSLVFGRYAQA